MGSLLFLCHYDCYVRRSIDGLALALIAGYAAVQP